MINPQWLELPMSRTNFHGPKDVRAIEVRLYMLHKVYRSLFYQQSNAKFGAFVKETLSTEGKTRFCAPVTRSGLKTFSDVKKKTPVITQGKASDMTISSELVFEEPFHYQRPERKC